MSKLKQYFRTLFAMHEGVSEPSESPQDRKSFSPGAKEASQYGFPADRGFDRMIDTPIAEIIADVKANPRNWRVRTRKNTSTEAKEAVRRGYATYRATVLHRPSGKTWIAEWYPNERGTFLRVSVSGLGFNLNAWEQHALRYTFGWMNNPATERLREREERHRKAFNEKLENISRDNRHQLLVDLGLNKGEQK